MELYTIIRDNYNRITINSKLRKQSFILTNYDKDYAESIAIKENNFLSVNR